MIDEDGKSEEEKQAIEAWKEKVKKYLDDLQELIKICFFEPGGQYSLEQLLDDTDDWDTLAPADKKLLLTRAGQTLGINLLNPPNENLLREYKKTGTPNTKNSRQRNYSSIFYKT